MLKTSKFTKLSPRQTFPLYSILHALGNKKENLAVFNLAIFHNLPNHQNKFYTEFSSYTIIDLLRVELTVTVLQAVKL